MPQRAGVGVDRGALVRAAEVGAVRFGAQGGIEQAQVVGDLAHDARVCRAGQHQGAAPLAFVHQVLDEGLLGAGEFVGLFLLV